MCLCWGLACVLRVTGGNAMRGLLSSDAYVEWSEAELGKQLLLPPLCNSDSLSQYTTILRPASKHSSNHYSNLSLQSSSTFSLSSHASQLTRHRLGTPSNALPPFWSPSFWPSDLPRYISVSPISNTFVPPIQWSTSYSFVRWQDAPSNESSGSFGRPGSAASLGIPTCLKDWIRGHPAMLPGLATRSRAFR
jgi:hypothetical protein